MSAIITSHLQRRFHNTIAVSDLSFEVKPGEIYGLIGPDGAGKTTTLRMLAGVLKPSSGRAMVLQEDVIRNPEMLRRRIGYMPQHFALYADLSVLENLTFFAEVFQVPRVERTKRIERLLQFAQLEHFANRPAGKLSGGMKKKLGLACTLIHSPQLLLLDEPTNGVDPVSRREFWDILSELHLESVTILITTSYMDEAERCNRVGLMFRGCLIQQGEPEALRLMAPGEMLVLYTPELAKTEEVLPKLSGYITHQIYGDRLHVFVSETASEDQLEALLSDANIPVHMLYKDEPRLEDAFIHLIRQARMEANV